MFKHKANRSPLNKALRIGYLRLQKRHGSEFIQEKAANIWKLTSEEQQRLEDWETPGLCEEFCDRLTALYETNKDLLTRDEQRWFAINILAKTTSMCYSTMGARVKRDEVLQFLDDITPVRLRIRKLTPRECFRLMDVKEEDIDKIASAGISNSQQYKMAGNSIVVSCMFHIFRKMFIDKDREANYGEQLTLF